MFHRLDANSDGVIDATEAAAAPGGIDVMLADADGDGGVTIDELRDYLAIQALQRAFDRVDANGDGVLDAAEIAASQNPARILAADADGDGQVTQAEFDAHVAAQQALRQAAAAAFQAADADGDHALSASEWPASATASFSDVDADGDGSVSRRELGEWIQANGSSPI